MPERKLTDSERGRAEMQITITEVNDVEGAWVESESATYSVVYEDEVRELAAAFGYHVSTDQYPTALDFLADMVGESAEAPEFLVEAENSPVL